MFLSNIDRVLNFNVDTIHFFDPNPNFPPEAVTGMLKKALEKVLVPYHFLAGRLRMNRESGRLEIECNRAGVGFVVASAECSLDEIGDLVYPNPEFRKLVVQRLDQLDGGVADQPLCIVQVTSFKCGGFVMGISTNHAAFDGISFKYFLENLASQAFDNKPLAVTPCNDRHLLAARSPPAVNYPHLELLNLKLPIGKDATNNPPVFDCSSEELDFKIFKLSSKEINYLKDKAKLAGIKPTTKITGFNAITAHVWRCKALSFGVGLPSGDASLTKERSSTVLYAVDIRPRLDPPLPSSYTGNAVLFAYATAKCGELERGPFGKILERVAEGAAMMTDEYARSAIDWGEVYTGFPHGEFMMSSWWRLGFADVEYPWGKPRYSCPVVCRRKDIILLFPGVGRDKDDGGVNILVALPAPEMEKFQSLFHELLV